MELEIIKNWKIDGITRSEAAIWRKKLIAPKFRTPNVLAFTTYPLPPPSPLI